MQDNLDEITSSAQRLQLVGLSVAGDVRSCRRRIKNRSVITDLLSCLGCSHSGRAQG